MLFQESIQERSKIGERDWFVLSPRGPSEDGEKLFQVPVQIIRVHLLNGPFLAILLPPPAFQRADGVHNVHGTVRGFLRHVQNAFPNAVRGQTGWVLSRVQARVKPGEVADEIRFLLTVATC